MVERIKEICAELQPRTLSKREVLTERDICGCQARRDNRIAPAIAKGSRGGRCQPAYDIRRVEIGQLGDNRTDTIWAIVQAVSTTLVAESQNRCSKTVSQLGQRGNLPAIDQVLPARPFG